MATEILHTVENGQSPDGNAHRSLEIFDALGIVASTVCMVHCLALPFIMAALPFTMSWLGHDNVHYLLAGWVFLFCLVAIVPGYLKHRQNSILISMLVGLSLVLAATFGRRFGMAEGLEVPMITVGNLLVIAAHWRNRKLTHAHVNCHH
jgi:hypothetical protein